MAGKILEDQHMLEDQLSALQYAENEGDDAYRDVAADLNLTFYPLLPEASDYALSHCPNFVSYLIDYQLGQLLVVDENSFKKLTFLIQFRNFSETHNKEHCIETIYSQALKNVPELAIGYAQVYLSLVHHWSFFTNVMRITEVPANAPAMRAFMQHIEKYRTSAFFLGFMTNRLSSLPMKRDVHPSNMELFEKICTEMEGCGLDTTYKKRD